MPRTPAELRVLAAHLKERALEHLRKRETAQAVLCGDEAEDLLAEAARLEGGLTGTKQSRTVRNRMATAADTAPEEWRKPPNMSELAAMLGCHRSFLSQARSGLSRIRLSWAERIAAVRPDLPATTKTWPKGWAPEEE